MDSLERISRGNIFGMPQAVPIVYDVVVKEGESLWKILEKLYSSNKDFLSLDPAGKINIIGGLSNKILREPAKYGLQTDGSIRVGDKLNFKTLFEDQEKIKQIIERASKLSEDQKKSILENNNKISAWISANTGKVLAPGMVSEILTPKIIPKAPEIKPEVKPEIKIDLKSEIEQQLKPKIETKVPETKIEPMPIAPRSMASDTAFAQQVESAFKSEINDIYGKGGMLGMGAVTGIDSKEWALMRKLLANDVLQYYTGDSTKSGLSVDVSSALTKSEKHHNLVKQLIGLMNETRGAVKPYENETVEQYFRRLGGFVMRANQKA